MSPSKASDISVDHLLSKRAAGRTFKHFGGVDLTGAAADFKPHPEPLSLSIGHPNAQYFPVKKITVELDNFPFQDSLFASEKEHTSVITIDRTEESGIGTGEALQYGTVDGIPAFQEFLKSFVDTVHKPAVPQWSVVPTNGSGDGLYKAANAIINPGDVVLMEEFTFIPFTNCVREVGGISVPIKVNFSGDNPDVDVEYLETLLENWDELKPEYKGNKPKAFYTIPTCQNPTGITQSVETRKKIYQLASIHDFVIIEDDPYGYLTLPEPESPGVENIKQYEISVEDYLENHLYPSYLQFDTEGRVLRLETFSKVFAPGLRLGFIAGNASFIKAIELHSNITTRAPSGASQLLLIGIINKRFGGLIGYLEWILKMRLAYIHRRNVVINTIMTSKAYDKGYLRVISCHAGMFAAIGIEFPELSDKLKKLQQLNLKFIEKGVGVVLGYKMAVDINTSRDKCNFLRICFAALDNDEQLHEAAKRLSDAVYEFFEEGLHL